LSPPTVLPDRGDHIGGGRVFSRTVGLGPSGRRRPSDVDFAVLLAAATEFTFDEIH